MAAAFLNAVAAITLYARLAQWASRVSRYGVSLLVLSGGVSRVRCPLRPPAYDRIHARKFFRCRPVSCC